MSERAPTAASPLGEFLSSRRAAVEPAAVGMSSGGYRRVVGLRREEVAVLAGVSVDYYTRLEQGRELHPSPQVLDALGRALMLEDDAREHLYRLAGAMPLMRDFAAPRNVSPELRQLLAELHQSPALVLNQALDVLARNELCKVLYSGFEVAADNSARMAFLDPLGRTFYDEWERAAESTVASLRLAAGLAPNDPRVTQLVDELSAESDDFGGMWERQTVRAKTKEIKRFNHPEAGPLKFSYQSFDVRGVPGQQLVVFGALPGDDSVARLTSLRGEG